MQTDLLNVLWVENDPEVIESYPLEAENEGLYLHPFECWDDALEALRKDYFKWDAIILDAKCKHHKDSADNATRFLVEVMSCISRLSKEYNRQINWYILSGGSAEEINDLIPEEREKWDGDWTKKYYSKNTERNLLFKRIAYHATISNRTHLKTVLYREVFEAIDRCKLDSEVEILMTDLLLPMHYPEITDKDYNNRFSAIRQVIECVFSSMIEQGILPRSLYTNTAGKMGVNLGWSSMFLSGNPHERSHLICYKTIFPKVLGDAVKNMIHATGAYLHHEDDDDVKSQRIHEFLRMTGNSSYLIRSFSLQLCDFILWYSTYLTMHPNQEENSKNWAEGI